MPTTEADGGTPLATERLTLRPVEKIDLPAIVRLAGDSEVAEWTVSIRHPLTPKQVNEWLSGCAGAGEHAFAILRKGEADLIGVVGLTVDDGGESAEIGYWVGREFWNQGYATEAVRRVLLFGFGVLGLTQVDAYVFPGNDASIRVLTNTGFAQARTGSRTAPARGGEREVIVYSLPRKEFARATLSQAVGRE
jgi:ribosomal-protein-alanine N-acetyltransferase